MISAPLNRFTSSVILGSMRASVTLGGGGGAVDNSIVRGYTYPNPATMPVTPKPYMMLYTDAAGTLFLCPANSTTWMIVNTVA